MASDSTRELLALVEKLEAIAERPPAELANDESLRRRLREAAKKASVAVEAPGDTVHRLNNTGLQLYMARVGTQIKLFEILSASEKPMSCADLAAKTGVDAVLMKRFLRYYQSLQMVAELGVDSFAANNVTRVLVPPLSSGVNYFADIVTPSFVALPEWIQKNNYQNPTDPNNVPWHIGHATADSPFAWLQAKPERLSTFITWMTQQHAGLGMWLDTFPFAQEAATNTNDDTVLFVDIGGAAGHQCVALREKFPNIPGRIILQDTPHTIAQVQAAGTSLPFEAQAHDFFTPQPVKDARVYYMRNIMHDWPDDKCVEILQNVIPAMGPDSVIIIDEMMLPESGTPWRSAQLDIAMLTCLAAKERSENEWSDLITSAGLEIVKAYKYSEECADYAIVCKPVSI